MQANHNLNLFSEKFFFFFFSLAVFWMLVILFIKAKNVL